MITLDGSCLSLFLIFFLQDFLINHLGVLSESVKFIILEFKLMDEDIYDVTENLIT